MAQERPKQWLCGCFKTAFTYDQRGTILWVKKSSKKTGGKPLLRNLILYAFYGDPLVFLDFLNESYDLSPTNIVCFLRD